MIEIVFLGTAAPLPTKERSLVSTLLISNGKKFLIDCGEGVQRQLLFSGRGFRGLSKVFITHDHADHLLGIGGLVFALDSLCSSSSLEIFSSNLTLAKVRVLVHIIRNPQSVYNLQVIQVPIEAGLVYEETGLRWEAFEVWHSTKSFGFVVTEAARRHLDIQKSDALEVPSRLRGRLVKGETVRLANGRRVTPSMVLAGTVSGIKVVYIPDTDFNESLIQICKNADCIISEATFLDRDKRLARIYKHLTVKEAAEVAKRSGSRKLVLNHISSRYRVDEVLNEARSVFARTIVPNDLQSIHIGRRRSGKL